MTNSKDWIRSTIFATVSVFILYRLLSGGMLTELHGAVLKQISADNFYWLMALTGLPDLLIANKGILMAICLLWIWSSAMFTISGKKIYLIIYMISGLTYFLLFNMYSGKHYHGSIGLLLIAIPFLASKSDHFILWWKAIRYYVLFIMVSAALWKIFRGSLFDPNHFASILIEDNLAYLIQNPESTRSEFLLGIVKTVYPTQLYVAAVLIQMSFLIGFFTLKFDKILLILFTGFHVFNYLVLGVFSAEMLVLGYVFVVTQKMQSR